MPGCGRSLAMHNAHRARMIPSRHLQRDCETSWPDNWTPEVREKLRMVMQTFLLRWRASPRACTLVEWRVETDTETGRRRSSCSTTATHFGGMRRELCCREKENSFSRWFSLFSR